MDIQYGSNNGYQSKSALVNFMINRGIVKSEGTANVILIAFIIVGFGITIYTIFS